MNMRRSPNYLQRFYTLLLLLVFVVSFANAGQQQGVLWQITPAHGKPSYLFGTIHSEDPRVLKLPAVVQRHFSQAKIFCAEMKMDFGTQLIMSQGMLFLDGQKLNKLIDKKLYDKTAALVTQYGIPPQMVPMLKPWAAGLLLSVPKPKTGNFLDLVLYQKAEQQGKALCGLETPGYVINLFESTSQKTQIKLLQTAVKEYDQMDKSLQHMLELYLARDLTGLQEYSDKEMAASDQDVTSLINESLLVKRNHNMLKTMQPQLKQGNAFIAVGALHLPGDSGLLRLLEKQGYQVKAVY
jgi:uncharacterized protein YbaP (TraB family)